MGETTGGVYRFGNGHADGDGSMRELLGGKGAGLAEMTALGIPVPPGFTITTDVCRSFMRTGALGEGHEKELREGLHWLEEQAGKRFGDPDDPLLVSVRSGAPVSMPGMMDTVLNVGLTDRSRAGLAARSGSERFSYDSYRRLLQMFGSVVLGVPRAALEPAHDETAELSEAVRLQRLRDEIERCQWTIQGHTGQPFPQDPLAQLRMAVEAVFRSWNSERAVFYRKLNGIAETMGTAVTVQAMVFGNRGETSGTGVGFTRDPSTGAPGVFGEYLVDAQGEDIVAGTRTPTPIAELSSRMPAVHRELIGLVTRLEEHYRDTQDFEFTVESGRLYLLQTRAAKRSARAAVRIAVDMAESGLITRAEAVGRVAPGSLVEILSPQLDLSAGPTPLTAGLPASPGAAVGQIALSANRAVTMKDAGMDVVLVTQDTTAEDIHGMAASVGFLTARGGATSHAAVVARGMGKCCITGAREIGIDPGHGTVTIGKQTLREGDWLSLEGSTGRVFAGRVPLRLTGDEVPELDTLLGWAREDAACAVRANADTPEDAVVARRAGASGIGLCRTEHMFFRADRLPVVRRMILAETEAARRDALGHLLPMQQADFEEIFRTMAPLPVTIRLLDPPLHEFLPSVAEITAEIASQQRDEDYEQAVSLQRMRARVEVLTESNPMLGHRGCRLSITYPEILDMQIRAILQAALAVRKDGPAPCPEIMVPLVSSEQEIAVLAAMIHRTADAVFAERGESIGYRLGTMIELPRAAVCAGTIARHVSFISFGTNDLTQMTFGFSRDDAYVYLDGYLRQGILTADPFVTLDQEGVGALIRMAVASVRAVDPAIKVGICGEHGGDPDSIQFFKSLGFDYVSCSPSRLLVAQLAAAGGGPNTRTGSPG